MSLHRQLGAAVLLVGIVGIVIAIAGVVRGNPGPTLRAYVVLASVVIGVQVVVGGILFLGGHRPDERLHYLYGGLLVAAFPFARSLGITRTERGEAWALLGGTVAVTLFAIRAITTGGS